MKIRENVHPDYKIDRFRTLKYGIECAFRRFFLRLALGKRKYDYMCKTIRFDPRTRSARMVDIVVRKDAVEKRIEADWIKNIATWLDPYVKYKRITPYPKIDPNMGKGAENEKAYNIDNLVSKISPENCHGEADWGPDVGKEKLD